MLERTLRPAGRLRLLLSPIAPAVLLLLMPALGRSQSESAGRPARVEAEPVRLEIVTAAEESPEAVRLGPVTEEVDEGDGDAEPPPAAGLPREVRLTDGAAEVSVRPPSEARWRIRAEAQGFWSTPVSLGGAEPGSVRRLTLWPASDLTAELRVPKDHALPKRVLVRLAPVPGRDEVERPQPSGEPEIACPVEERRIVGCTLPAGRWNLRLSAPPFAPHLLWDLRLPAGEPIDLGSLELELGGSVSGWLATEAGPIESERARVSIRPALDERPLDPSERKRLHQLRHTGTVRPDGSFQLLGVAEGTYEIIATQPGLVPARRAPVRVERGEWTELREPLFLARPLRLSVQVDPASEPFGGPWTLDLYRVDERRDLRSGSGGTTDPAGYWESPPVAPGEYRIQVRDADGNSLLWQDVELSRTSSHARVEIPLVYVEGEVVIDGEPLKGTVWFGGRFGEERVEAESDENGQLVAVLPRDGQWLVDVRAESPPVRSRGLEVEIGTVSDSDVAEVRIEVPNTSLTGRVVDEQGNPAPDRTRVFLLPQSGEVGPSYVWADARGEFELHGVPPETYRVSAEVMSSGPDRASAQPVIVDVGEGLERSVTLILRREQTVTGRVVSPSGPVPGAQIWAYPLTRRGLEDGLRIPSTQTSADGRFELSVSGTAEAVRLDVKAPGYALAIRRVSDLEQVEIVLGREMGTVRLDGVERLVSVGEDGEVGVLLVDGEVLGLNRVRSWADSERETTMSYPTSVTVPEMPPGPYQLCRMRLQEARLLLRGAAVPKSDACAGGFLPAGATLRLRAP